MNKVKQIKMVTTSVGKPTTFEDTVNNYIKEGYQLLGELHIASTDNQSVLIQQLVLYEEENT